MSGGGRAVLRRISCAAVVIAVLAVLVPLTGVRSTTQAGAAVGAVNILFTAPGDPARYIGSQVVAIEAGNINFVPDCKTLPNGSGDRLVPGINDNFQPFADIYIVQGLPPSPDSDLVDSGGGAPNVVHGGLGGSFLYEPLGVTKPAGQIRSGTYGIVVDECQNKVFDAGEDTYIPNAFRVDTKTFVPGISPEVEAFNNLKQWADRGATAIDELEVLLALKDAYELGQQMYGAATAALSVEGAATYFLNQTISIIVDSGPYAVLKDRAETIAKETYAQHKTRLNRLAADPPDPNFSRLALPASSGAWFEESSTPMAEAFAAYTAEIDVLSALSGTILDAVERYQGAQAAGDATWALRHARVLQAATVLYEERMTAFGVAADRLRTEVGVIFGPPFAGQNIARTIQNVRNHLAIGGLETSFQLMNTGVDAPTAHAVLDRFDELYDIPALDSVATWYRILDETEASLIGFGDGLADFRALVGDLESELETTVADDDVDPTLAISITGSLAAGVTVDLALDGLAGRTAGVQWDLDGDGQADDASGVETTWQVPGDAIVGAPLVVTAVASGAGFQSSTTEIVTVAPGGNRAPVLDGLDRTVREVAPGTTVPFEVGASDPDGDPLTYEWLVDGVVQTGEAGPTFDLVFGPDEFGGRHVEVLVSDGAALSRWEWFARTVTPDADRDGFRAAPGPDCEDVDFINGVNPFFIKPSQPEAPGNGVDDDCSDATPDDGSGSVGFVSIANLFTHNVGDEVSAGINWNHPQRFSGAEFRLTMDWGDGSEPDVVTVAGTTDAATNIGPLTHRFTREDLSLLTEACIEVVSTGYTFCGTRPAGALNNRPIVNAADLRTWGPSEESGRPDGPLLNPFQPLDPDGRQVISSGNPDYAVVHPAGVDLPGGYGRAALNFQHLGQLGDDDNIAMAFGYEPGEANSADPDYVIATWSHAADHYFACADPPVRINERQPAMQAFRTGPHSDCYGPDGLQRVGSVGLGETSKVGSSLYKARATSGALRQSAGFNPDPYLVEFDYQPDSLRVWVDGVFQYEATPIDPTDPFPPGAIAFWQSSMGNVRYQGTAPEPTFDFVQGKGGELSEEPADGISVPMIDGALDTHVIRIDWGDGSATTEGTRTANPAKGWGWFDITGDHVYERAGTFEGNVCATDQHGLGMCFPFTAVVTNVGPDVDAGPDRPADATVSLDDMTFRDPGLFDTHIATIDWGDGTGPEPADVDAVLGGGVVSGTHTYSSSGDVDVEVCVTDQDGATSCDSRRLSVQAENAAPVAQTVTGPTVPEGSDATVPVGFTDANGDDTHTITVDWGDGGGQVAVDFQDGGDFGSGSPTHVYADDGIYTVTFEVCDQEAACDTATTTVDVTNVAPDVAASVAATDGDATLSAVYSDPGTDDTHTATVDWGAGAGPEPVPVTTTADGGTIADSTSYPTPGTYDVEVCVTDDDGETGCDLEELEITEVAGSPPVVAADPVDPATEGDVVTVDATYVDPDAGDTHTATVDWGDGTLSEQVIAAGGTLTGTHTYADDSGAGSFTVVIEVCDATARCDSAEVTVTIVNDPPSVDAGRNRTTDGVVVLDDTTFTDAGTADTHTATVDWGDGAGPQSTTVVDTPTGGIVQGTVDYATEGERTVTVCVEDDDAASDCDSFDVDVVFPVVPIEVTAGPAGPVDEGSPVSVPFSFTDADGGTHTARIGWGDGTPGEDVDLDSDGTSGAGGASHTYIDDGTYGVSVEVCGSGSRCGVAPTTVAVTNVAPTVTAPAVVVDGAGVELSAAITDPGVADTHTATVDWGDGTGPEPATVSGRTAEGSHTYAEAGEHDVEVCATDDDGATGCVEIAVTAGPPANVAPLLTIDDPVDLAEGSTFELVGSFVDPDADAWVLSVDWGDGSVPTSVPLAVAGAFVAPHTYVDDGTFTIVAALTDGTDSDEVTLASVDVANVAPTVAFDPTVDGLTVDLDVDLDDPGADVLSATVDWGDGTVEAAASEPSATAHLEDPAARASARADVAVSHTYRRAGTYSIEVCGSDADGGRSCVTQPVVLIAAATPPTSDAPSDPAVRPGASPTSLPVVVDGSGSGRPTSVASAGAPSGGALAKTGGDPWTSIWLGLAFIAGGLVLVASTTRSARRRRAEPAGGTGR